MWNPSVLVQTPHQRDQTLGDARALSDAAAPPPYPPLLTCALPHHHPPHGGNSTCPDVPTHGCSSPPRGPSMAAVGPCSGRNLVTRAWRPTTPHGPLWHRRTVGLSRGDAALSGSVAWWRHASPSWPWRRRTRATAGSRLAGLRVTMRGGGHAAYQQSVHRPPPTGRPTMTRSSRRCVRPL